MIKLFYDYMLYVNYYYLSCKKKEDFWGYVFLFYLKYLMNYKVNILYIVLYFFGYYVFCMVLIFFL